MAIQRDRRRQYTARAAQSERAEPTLRASEERFRAILKAATEYSIIGTDPSGVITVFNEGAERMLGYRAEELIGQATPIRIHDPAEVAVRAAELGVAPGFEVFVAAARRGRAETREWTYVRKDGSRLPVSLTVTAMRDEQEQLIGFMGIASDISERQRAERALSASEAFSREILNALPAEIAVIDSDGFITAVNEAWLRFAQEHGNYAAAPAGVGSNYLGVLRAARGAFASGAQQALVGIEAVLSGRQGLFTREYACDLPSGTRWYLLYVTPLAGGRHGAVTAHLDITQRKQAEAALRASEERYRAIVQTAHEGVWLIDDEARTLYVNDRMAALLGYPAAETLGRHVLEFCFPEDRAAVQERISSHLADHPEEFEFRFRRRDGTAVPVQAAASLVRDSQGQIIGALGMFADLTERKRLEASQRALQRAREEFLAAAAHDLKTPLSAIRCLAEVQQRRARTLSTPETADFDVALGRIDLLANEAVSQIDALLDVARLQIGQPLLLEREPVDLVDLVKGQAARCRELGTEHTIRVRAARQRLVGTWDRRRLERVLGNLHSNAIKYSPQGGTIMVTLRQEATPTGPWAVLTVRDRGIGIPTAEVGQVFDRFFRASNVQGRVSGTGIGLAGTRQIVEQHGGTITVRSREGHGTIFTVRLPLSETDAVNA